MKVERLNPNQIMITLEGTDEREVMSWIEGELGPGYLRKWLVKLFDDKRRAMKYLATQRNVRYVELTKQEQG